eukprot:3515748-Prymnesium_polylepis.1
MAAAQSAACRVRRRPPAPPRFASRARASRAVASPCGRRTQKWWPAPCANGHASAELAARPPRCGCAGTMVLEIID